VAPSISRHLFLGFVWDKCPDSFEPPQESEDLKVPGQVFHPLFIEQLRIICWTLPWYWIT
jgi:hypothetical protein